MFRTAIKYEMRITRHCCLCPSERLHFHLWRAPTAVSGHLSRDWLRHGLEAQGVRGRERQKCQEVMAKMWLYSAGREDGAEA